jgi:hypothetical protein
VWFSSLYRCMREIPRGIREVDGGADASDARHPAGRICCSCCLYVVVDPLVSRGLEGTLLLSEQRYTGYCIRTLEHPHRTLPGEQGLTGNRLSRLVLGVIDYGMPG